MRAHEHADLFHPATPSPFQIISGTFGDLTDVNTLQNFELIGSGVLLVQLVKLEGL
jgi:hypothetical protein